MHKTARAAIEVHFLGGKWHLTTSIVQFESRLRGLSITALATTRYRFPCNVF